MCKLNENKIFKVLGDQRQVTYFKMSNKEGKIIYLMAQLSVKGHSS